MEDKATPRPWAAVDLKKRGNFPRVVETIRGLTVATCFDDPSEDLPTEESQANAALIVRAVNSYEAHRHLADTISGVVSWLEMPPKTREIIEAALAAVESAENA